MRELQSVSTDLRALPKAVARVVPQGPAPVRQRKVVSNSCFLSSKSQTVNCADAPRFKGRICVFHPCGLRLETTGTTGKNNERTPKECCFKQLFPIIKKPDGELCRYAQNPQARFKGRICVFHPCGLRLETTGTTGKNNERTPKECCFKQLFPIIKKQDGELRRCARSLRNGGRGCVTS